MKILARNKEEFTKLYGYKTRFRGLDSEYITIEQDQLKKIDCTEIYTNLNITTDLKIQQIILEKHPKVYFEQDVLMICNGDYTITITGGIE